MALAQVFGGARRARGEPPLEPVEFTLAAAGGWTWYNDERAICANGYTFVGFNGGGGGGSDMLAARVDAAGTITTGTITTTGSLDDHMVPSLVRFPSGTLAAFYADNPQSAVLYRKSTNPDDVTAWGSGLTTPSTPFNTVYAQPRYLSSPARLVLFTRCVIDTNTRRHYYNVSDDEAASWGSWVEWCRPPSTGIPYLLVEQHGDRLYIFMSDGHPGFAATSLYAGYAEWSTDDGALRFYKLDGTHLSSLPFNPSAMTLVYDGTSQRSWNWDMKIGADGHPRFLFTKYPSNDGTDIRLMFARWDGSAITTPVDIVGASVGTSLYGAEPFYTGGACFDGNDVGVIYLAREVTTGIYEMQKWRSQNTGDTWAKVRDLSTETASGNDNYRPVSPVGHPDTLAVIWPQGVYTTFLNWTTALRAANAAG